MKSIQNVYITGYKKIIILVLYVENIYIIVISVMEKYIKNMKLKMLLFQQNIEKIPIEIQRLEYMEYMDMIMKIYIQINYFMIVLKKNYIYTLSQYKNDYLLFNKLK